MGEKQINHPALVQRFAEDRFPKIARDPGWEPHPVHRLGESLGFGELFASTRRLTEGRNTQLPLADLLHQSGYSGMAGYEDVNDAERLSTRSDVPADRFGEDLGPWGGATSRLQSYTSQLR